MVRLSGPDAIAIGRQIFRGTGRFGDRAKQIEFGRVLDADCCEIDTALAWAFHAPASYTGEETVEISTHGSAVVLEHVVESALARGATLAQPGEFTRRAFMNGTIDLVQAEAVIDLIQAESRGSLVSAYAAANGRLSGEVRHIKAQIVQALSWIELSLDFTEEDVEPVQQQRTSRLLREVSVRISGLAATFESARRRQEGYRLVLLGRPNAGKSTLLNALLGEDRAIVAPTPGTTRDLVEGRAIWRGETIRLFDTAGIRVETDPVERDGIDRTWRAAAEADCAVVVMDCTKTWDAEDGALLSRLSGMPAVIAMNKCDLPSRLELPMAVLRQHGSLSVSALDGTGLDQLRAAAQERLFSRVSPQDAGVLRQRHSDLLIRAGKGVEEAATSIDEGAFPECGSAALRESLAAIGEVLGERVDEVVLDQIFSEFCIGK